MTKLFILLTTAIAFGLAADIACADTASAEQTVASNLSAQTWNSSAWMLTPLTTPTTQTGAQTVPPSSSNDPSNFVSAMQKERALGLVRYQLDHRTAVLGWQVAPRWFLGQQRGDDSGLTLVWQKDGSDQLSLSKDGVRISRRF